MQNHCLILNSVISHYHYVVHSRNGSLYNISQHISALVEVNLQPLHSQVSTRMFGIITRHIIFFNLVKDQTMDMKIIHESPRERGRPTPPLQVFRKCLFKTTIKVLAVVRGLQTLLMQHTPHDRGKREWVVTMRTP